MVLSHLALFFFDGATGATGAANNTFSGHVAHLGVYGFFDGFSGVESEPEPEPQPAVQSSGGRVKKRAERYALKVDDKWLIFSSWDELEEYLESLKQEELEESEEKVEKAVNRILRTGKAPKKAPRIVIQSAPKEVREQVDLLNAEIERVFWMKVHEELSARADEEDIEILLGVI